MFAPDKSNFDFASLADFAVQFLAVAYGVFATASDFKEERDGKKLLSRVGKIGIAFLVAVSIASIGVKIYQHQKDVKAKADADATQLKMIADLEQSLNNSKAMSKALDNADAKLTQQANALQNQSTKMNGLIEGSERNLRETSRVLDPLDESLDVTISEAVSLSDPEVQAYLRRKPFVNIDSDLGAKPRYFRVRNTPDSHIVIVHGVKEEASAWPGAEDGNFGEFMRLHWMELVIHPPNSDLSGTNDYKAFDPKSLKINLACSSGGKFNPTEEILDLHEDNISLSCRLTEQKWERVGGEMKSYLDLQGREVFVRVSGDPERKMTAIKLKRLGVTLQSKHHKIEIVNFKEIPCPWGKGWDRCYSSSTVPKPHMS
jgi:hypothetical protein